MNTHADKTEEKRKEPGSAANDQMQNRGTSTFQFVDNRSEAVAQRKLQDMANNSQQVSRLIPFQDMADNHSAQHLQPLQTIENKPGLADNFKPRMESLSITGFG